MTKQTIELKWIEPPATVQGIAENKAENKQVTITAEVENNKLNLIQVACFPAIICITCGTLGSGPCRPALA